MCQMGEAGKRCQLVSMHSVSKGFVGECGRRGGYAELSNFRCVRVCAGVCARVCVRVCVRVRAARRLRRALKLQVRACVCVVGCVRVWGVCACRGRLPGLDRRVRVPSVACRAWRARVRWGGGVATCNHTTITSNQKH